MKRLLSIGIILLFIGMSISSSTGFNTVEQLVRPFSSGNTLYVGGFGPSNYTKIQDAIDNASDWDTIFVYNGIYYENVIVDKSINLIGEDRDTTIIDGKGNDTVRIKTNQVSLSNILVRNATKKDNAGVIISYDRIYCSVRSCEIVNNYWGIQIHGDSDNCLIENCNIINSTDRGIYDNQGHYNHTIINNRIYGGGISLYQGDNSTIMNNFITKSDVGIELDRESSYNIIVGNILDSNTDGIILHDCEYNGVARNIITNNKGNGIYLHYYTYYNTIVENELVNNSVGINFQSGNSYYNMIIHNNFINNFESVIDENLNTWNLYYPSCGNYWSDYRGVDNFSGPQQDIPGSDGVGDTPYYISLYSPILNDRYPLMEPYRMTELSFSPGPRFPWSIINIGNKTAFNVQWNITIDGGFILLGRKSSGTIPKPLLPGEEFDVKSKLIFGLGRVIITIELWADNVPYVSESNSGLLLLFFILL